MKSSSSAGADEGAGFPEGSVLRLREKAKRDGCALNLPQTAIMRQTYAGNGNERDLAVLEVMTPGTCCLRPGEQVPVVAASVRKAYVIA